MSLRSSSQQPPGKVYMSNAIGSSRESNPSRRICRLRAVSLGHATDIYNFSGPHVARKPQVPHFWPSGTVRRLQILRDGFDSRLEQIVLDVHIEWLLTRRAQAFSQSTSITAEFSNYQV